MSDKYLKSEIGFLVYTNDNSVGALKLTDINHIKISNKNTSVYNLIINNIFISQLIIEDSKLANGLMQRIINNVIYHIRYDLDKNLNINELIDESMKKEHVTI